MLIRILILIFAYLLGAVPFGLLVAKGWKGIDLRALGSGNIGASNVLRVLGPAAGAVVLFADTVKGILPVMLAILVAGKEAHLFLLACGLAVVCGHNWSVFIRFQGGRGVATSLGVLIALTPRVALIALIVWLVILALTRYISLASIVGALSLPVGMVILREPRSFQLVGLLLCLMVITRHRANIQRLIAGQEFKIGQKVKVEDA